MKKLLTGIVICIFLVLPGVASAHAGHDHSADGESKVARVEHTATKKEKGGVALAVIVGISTVIVASAAYAGLRLGKKRDKKS